MAVVFNRRIEIGFWLELAAVSLASFNSMSLVLLPRLSLSVSLPICLFLSVSLAVSSSLCLCLHHCFSSASLSMCGSVCFRRFIRLNSKLVKQSPCYSRGRRYIFQSNLNQSTSD